MRIVKLEAENFLRLRALTIEIDEDESMVVISGRNGQGKTSALRAIECLLAGKGSVPERPVHGDEDEARIVAQLSPSARFPQGLIVRRIIQPDRRTTLTISEPEGGTLKGPQGILDELIGRISFDPLDFARMAPKERMKVIAELAGIDTDEWARKREGFYERRRDANREVKRLDGALGGIPAVPNAPKALVSMESLTARLNTAMESHNAVRDARRAIEADEGRVQHFASEVERLERELAEARAALASTKDALEQSHAALAEAEENAIDPTPIREAIGNAEKRNELYRQAERRRAAEEELRRAKTAAGACERDLEAFDEECREVLASASWPIDGLGLSENDVTFQGVPFSQASSSEQIRVGLAVGIALNPEVRVLLVREGSLLDNDSLRELAQAAAANDAQLIVECVNAQPGTVIIEDGLQVEEGAKR